MGSVCHEWRTSASSCQAVPCAAHGLHIYAFFRVLIWSGGTALPSKDYISFGLFGLRAARPLGNLIKLSRLQVSGLFGVGRKME